VLGRREKSLALSGVYKIINISQHKNFVLLSSVTSVCPYNSQAGGRLPVFTGQSEVCVLGIGDGRLTVFTGQSEVCVVGIGDGRLTVFTDQSEVCVVGIGEKLQLKWRYLQDCLIFN
jgi:hypothetical protein